MRREAREYILIKVTNSLPPGYGWRDRNGSFQTQINKLDDNEIKLKRFGLLWWALVVYVRRDVTCVICPNKRSKLTTESVSISGAAACPDRAAASLFSDCRTWNTKGAEHSMPICLEAHREYKQLTLMLS